MRLTLGKNVHDLLSQRRMPDEGWEDATIEHLLMQLSMMDSNNFASNVKEREKRVYFQPWCRSVCMDWSRQGRSGDVTAVQPKAAGSSLIVQLSSNDVKLVQNFGYRTRCVILVKNRHVSALTLLMLKSTIRIKPRVG